MSFGAVSLITFFDNLLRTVVSKSFSTSAALNCVNKYVETKMKRNQEVKSNIFYLIIYIFFVYVVCMRARARVCVCTRFPRPLVHPF